MYQGGPSMPRAALGLAVFVVSGAFSPVLAQTLPPTSPPVVGRPVVSTSFPPEPVPSRSLPPEPGASTTPVTNLSPILGAPVLPVDQQTPGGTIRPVAGERNDIPSDTDVI